MGIKHAFVSAVPDGPAGSVVRPVDWNAEHVSTETYFPAASVTKTTGGAETGSISGCVVPLDGVVYSVVEATGVPGFDILFEWTAVTATPTHIVLRQRYDGTASHIVTVDVWKYATSAWVTVHQIVTALDYSLIEIPIPDFSPYMSGTATKIRVYHPTSGNASHTQYFDYVALRASSAAGSQGPAGTNATALTAWPVGSVFIGVTSTSPATLLGGGTWAAFGAGRVLVGIDTGGSPDADFDTVEETGGAKTVTVTGTNTAEATHTHSVTSNVTVADHGAHTHAVNASGTSAVKVGTSSSNAAASGHTHDTGNPNATMTHTPTNNAVTSGAGASHNHAFTGNATSVVQPYIVVYMWKRTA